MNQGVYFSQKDKSWMVLYSGIQDRSELEDALEIMYFGAVILYAIEMQKPVKRIN